MADAPKRSKTFWLVIGCVGLAALSVPCIGILAAIAIPAFVNYARRAKTVEAQTNVAMIARGVTEHCVASGVLPDAVGPSISTPSATRQIQDFDAPGWQAVGFSSGDPLYYAYSIVRPDASSLQVIAEGDLDDDGLRSRFEIDCATTGPASCSCGELIVTNDLE
jgi:type II secretory pathway pseudopilin PulG